MLKFSFKFLSVSSLVLLSACQNYDRVPVAMNKPQNLTTANNNYETRENTQMEYSEDFLRFYDYMNSVPQNNTNLDVRNYFKSVEKQKDNKQDGLLKIAVILPFNNKEGTSVAKDLKNSSLMALFDNKSPNTILQFYNSDGTAKTAKKLGIIAEREDADIIIGPLFKDEVDGLNGLNIPVISFTTNSSVLSNNIFSIGFLIDQQLQKLVEFATANNKKNFAVIVPNSVSGRYVYNNLKKYINYYDGNIVAYENFEVGNNKSLLNSVKSISQYDERIKEYNEFKIQLQEKLQLATDEIEKEKLQTELTELSKKITISQPKYDSVFIFADDINDVVIIGSTLLYYDVQPSQIQFMGTSQLANDKVYKEKAFNYAWFPSITTKYNARFNKEYTKYFKTEPSKLASLAYDAVALSINLGSKKGYIEPSDITSPNGWTGINGVFRFRASGKSERNMDIKQISPASSIKSKIISPANSNFINTK